VRPTPSPIAKAVITARVTPIAVSFFHSGQDGFVFDISRFSEATASVVFVAIVAVVLDVSECGIEGSRSDQPCRDCRGYLKGRKDIKRNDNYMPGTQALILIRPHEHAKTVSRFRAEQKCMDSLN
jgi:hypothetical protein